MAEETLGIAYRNVFRGNATKAEAETVLADLCNYSGFVKVFVPSPGVSLEFENGKRDVYGRIFRFLAMTTEEINDLHQAARAEALTDSQEGPLI